MDGYSADSDIHAYERSQMPMVQYARWALMGTAGLYALTALLAGAGVIGTAFIDQRPDEELYGMLAAGICTPLAMMLCGVLPPAAASVGLSRGAKWGWIMSIVVGALYVPNLCCLPVGVFLLYAMLNDDVRQAFSDA